MKNVKKKFPLHQVSMPGPLGEKSKMQPLDHSRLRTKLNFFYVSKTHIFQIINHKNV